MAKEMDLSAEKNKGFFARVRERVGAIFGRGEPDAAEKEQARGMEKLESMGCEIKKRHMDGTMTMADRDGREFDLPASGAGVFVVSEGTMEKAAVEGPAVIEASKERLGLTDANIEAYIGHLVDAKAFAEEHGLSHERSMAISRSILYWQNGLETGKDFESWKNFVTPERSAEQIDVMVSASRDGIDLSGFDFPLDMDAEKIDSILIAYDLGMPESMANALIERQASLDIGVIDRLKDLTRTLAGDDGQLSPEAQAKLELVVAAAQPDADGYSPMDASKTGSMARLIELDQSHLAPPHEPLTLAQISTVMDKAEVLSQRDFYSLCYDVTMVMTETGTRDKFLSELSGMSRDEIKATLAHEEKLWGDPVAQFRDRIGNAARNAADAVRNVFSRTDHQEQAEKNVGQELQSPESKEPAELSEEDKAREALDKVPAGIESPVQMACLAHMIQENVPKEIIDEMAEHHNVLGDAGFTAMDAIVTSKGAASFDRLASALEKSVAQEGSEMKTLINELKQIDPKEVDDALDGMTVVGGAHETNAPAFDSPSVDLDEENIGWDD